LLLWIRFTAREVDVGFSPESTAVTSTTGTLDPGIDLAFFGNGVEAFMGTKLNMIFIAFATDFEANFKHKS
jgi:hypothetical protein